MVFLTHVWYNRMNNISFNQPMSIENVRIFLKKIAHKNQTNKHNKNSKTQGWVSWLSIHKTNGTNVIHLPDCEDNVDYKGNGK